MNPEPAANAIHPARPTHFTVESYPSSPRRDAWRAELARFCLAVGDESLGADLRGTLTSSQSPQGLLLGRVASRDQAWRLDGPRGAGTTLVLHLEGRAVLTTDRATVEIAPGDLVYAIWGSTADLAMHGDFRQLLVRLPRGCLQARLAAPPALRAVRLQGSTGVGHVLSQLLQSVAATLDEIGCEGLHSLDLAVPEFLSSVLASSNDDALLAATSGQTATLHRISQLIESQLGAPELSATDIAAQAGVSLRYLQKLFENVNDSFGRYLRTRRLERSRADLVNPLYMHLSITDICYRWGFNDAGHFSRSFREQFGVSPRTYRTDTAERLSRKLLNSVSRGWPDITHDHYVKLTRNESSPVSSPRDAGPGVARSDVVASGRRHHHLPVNEQTVHWGYFSHALAPSLQIASGDYVTIETLSHHCGDDYDRMIKDDPGAESVYRWSRGDKAVARRGAGPMGANIFGRGAGEGFGVHICTGPVAIEGAEPGDVVEIRILDVRPRPSASTEHADRAYGSNTAAWWGYQYHDMLTEPRKREVVTIYEIDCENDPDTARAIYSYRWAPQQDPDGGVHPTIDYPGLVVDHEKVIEDHAFLKDVRVPVRPHFGLIALAPREADLVDSTPPSHFGGNLDNRRAGKGATVYLPVSMPGGLLSIGAPHAAQGDGEVSGTAIDCSMTGVFQIILHKKTGQAGRAFDGLTHPLLETRDEWIVHGFTSANYLGELGKTAQSEIYKRSSLDTAMRDAFRKMRRFLMTAKGLSEDEAVSLMSVAVDFGVGQVVNGNWCVHAVLPKSVFGEADENAG